MLQVTKMLRKLELAACVDFLNEGAPAHVVCTERFGEYMIVTIETGCINKWNAIREGRFEIYSDD